MTFDTETFKSLIASVSHNYNFTFISVKKVMEVSTKPSFLRRTREIVELVRAYLLPLVQSAMQLAESTEE